MRWRKEVGGKGPSSEFSVFHVEYNTTESIVAVHYTFSHPMKSYSLILALSGRLTDVITDSSNVDVLLLIFELKRTSTSDELCITILGT